MNNFDRYIVFNRKERIALLCLGIILLILLSTHYLYFNDTEPTKDIDLESIITKEDYDYKAVTSSDAYAKWNTPKAESPFSKEKNKYSSKKSIAFDPKPFDPNKATKDEMIAMGLPKYWVSNLVKYREKGKQFRDIDDIASVYGASDTLMQRIRPYVTFDITNFKPKHTKKTIAFNPKPFDPNKATKNEMIAMGLPKYWVSNLVKYREKGKQFRNVDDIASVYGASVTLIQRIEPYVTFDTTAFTTRRKKTSSSFDTSNDKKDTTYAKKKKPLNIPPIDINTADADILEILPGIGPSFAKRIIKYRNMLGGYHDVNQIKDVYGMPPETFEGIKQYIVLDTPPNRLYINSAITDTLAAHPLISWKQAKIIKKYIAQHGPFASADDIKKTRVFTDESIKKLKPYISVE